jgi:hypothetical protein
VKVIAFLGPSLSAAEAKSLLGCEIRPPARQGDVFRALPGAPDALVLLDGQVLEMYLCDLALVQTTE